MDILEENGHRVAVPDWVKFIAVDASGMVFGHMTKPIQNSVFPVWLSYRAIFLYQGPAPKDWTRELYAWS